MKRYLPLAVVLAIVLAYNWPAFNYSEPQFYKLMPDLPGLERNWPTVADKPLGGLDGWTGKWWAPQSTFRPISGHVYWLCMYFIHNGAAWLSTALVMALSLALCVVVYLLAHRLTNSVWAAMFAGVLAGVMRLENKYLDLYIPERAAWAYFPILDNTLAALFLSLGALLLLRRREWLAFGVMGAALFCKELAIVMPAIMLAFLWERRRERQTQVLLGTSVAVVATFLVYRFAVIVPTHDKAAFSLATYQSWWIYQAWLIFAQSGNPFYVLSYAFDTAPHFLRELSLVLASLWLLRLSARLPQFCALWPAMASFMALYVPLLATNTVSYRFVMPLPFFCVSAAIALHGILPLIAALNPQQWISRHKPDFLVAQGAAPNSEVIYNGRKRIGTAARRRA